MCQLGFDIIQGVGWLLQGVIVIVFLVIVVEIDEVCVVVTTLLPLRAVASKVTLLSTLEAGVISCAMQRSLSISHISPSCTSPSPTHPIV